MDTSPTGQPRSRTTSGASSIYDWLPASWLGRQSYAAVDTRSDGHFDDDDDDDDLATVIRVGSQTGTQSTAEHSRVERLAVYQQVSFRIWCCCFTSSVASSAPLHSACAALRHTEMPWLILTSAIFIGVEHFPIRSGAHRRHLALPRPSARFRLVRRLATVPGVPYRGRRTGWRIRHCESTQPIWSPFAC